VLRQCLKAGDEKAQSPHESHPYGTANTPQGNPLQQYALNQRPCGISDEGLVRTLDELASAVFALMMLFVIINVTIFLLLR